MRAYKQNKCVKSEEEEERAAVRVKDKELCIFCFKMYFSVVDVVRRRSLSYCPGSNVFFISMLYCGYVAW